MKPKGIFSTALGLIGYSIGNVVGGVRAGANYQWEGHEVDRRRGRTAARLVSQDTDLDFGDREKMGSEARRLVQTFPIVRRIPRQYSNYCVGNCRVQWN